ncbi:MAG TPA: cobalamin-binding protein [Blastocatellia bacterium]|nr:cobalamin-binding protein [Blastocatellia bacterium]
MNSISSLIRRSYFTGGWRPLTTAARVAVALRLAGLALALSFATSCQPTTKSAPDATHEFTDEIGRKVTLKPNPERIVSLAPSITETLYALGLVDRVVGVTTFCDYPPEVRSKENVGDTLRPNIERIVSLKPDLVIVSTASQLEQSVKRLEELGIPVYVTNARDLDGVIGSIERTGEITGASDRAKELAIALRRRIDAVRARVEGRVRPPVFFILGSEPLITAGGSSFINDLITRAGGRSISSGETAEYPQYSLETAVARQPEVVFLQAGEGSLPARLEQTPAARAGRVYILDDALLLRPGPRIVDGLEQMAARIHPER